MQTLFYSWFSFCIPYTMSTVLQPQNYARIMKMVAATAATGRLTRMLSTASTTVATSALVWSVISNYLPHELKHIIQNLKQKIMELFYPYIMVTIHEFRDPTLSCRRSEAYAAVEAYLRSIPSKTSKRFRAEVETFDSNKLVLSMDDNQTVQDEFHGAKLEWGCGRSTFKSSYGCSTEQRYYKLIFHKAHRELATKLYLEHVIKLGREIKKRKRPIRMYTNKGSATGSYGWAYSAFHHPASFETLAMDEGKKKEIVEDLLAFKNGKDYYARIGKAWKRGYLLYGPPGTRKSTMIAAMAKLLDYDIYDLELTAVKENTELRKLLIETNSRSIIVMEDIDCSLDVAAERTKETAEKAGENRVTLSGLLNFIDGLWSSSSEGEKIIVFTTNHVEDLDEALIRRGRMDVHIELSYCSFEGFKVLAKNYLNIETHQMFDEIEKLIGEVNITPADVAENLMPKSPVDDDPDKYLSNLIGALGKAQGKS